MAAETVYLSVGSNIDPEIHVRQAVALLSRSMTLVGISTFYRTAAIDRPDQPDYFNGVVKLETELPPGRLRAFLRELEHTLGRVRTDDPFAARTIDLDILVYGDAIVSDDGLEIPDPEIRERPFLVAGLLELQHDLHLPGAKDPLSREVDLNPATLTAVADLSRALKEKYA